MKLVDLGEPTTFLDHVYWGCTQRECKSNENIVEEYNQVLETRIPAGATQKLPGWEKHPAKTVAWSCDMEGHAQKCVERCCELANKKTEQLYKVSSPFLDDHHFKKEKLEPVGELSKVLSQIVLKCLYLARVGRPDILWSVNQLARSVTNWSGARDKLATRRKDGQERKTMYLDVQKAHLAPRCEQDVYVEDECGKLIHWLCGCRPAAQASWEEHYSALLKEHGFQR